MPQFITYDLTFLVLFTIFIIWFLHKNRHRLGKEGIIYLYRTQLGVKWLDRFAKKNKNLLKHLEWPIIILGYLLMLSIIVIIISALYQYLTLSSESPIADTPPVLLLIPYFPSIFGVSSLFPPFYFTYFILAVLIIAVVHEAAHGIFMRLYKLRIKSTGFAFLGPILGAFVEQDEKQMNKAPSRKQKVILAAGVSANILTAIVFGIIMALFFSLAFTPAGVNIVGAYPNQIVNTSDISLLGNESQDSLVSVVYQGETFLAHQEILDLSLENNLTHTWIYDKSPALDAELVGPPTFQTGVYGAITHANGIPISTVQDLQEVISQNSPGDELTLDLVKAEQRIISPLRSVYAGEEIDQVTLTLADRGDGTAFAGILSVPESEPEVHRKLVSLIFYTPADDLTTYYYSKLGNFGIFFHYLLWWIVSINILVAIFNMIPASIFDGGRFFYLTILDITKNVKKAEKAYIWSGKIILLIFILLIARWIINLFL